MDVDGIIIAAIGALSGGGGYAAWQKAKAEQFAAREKGIADQRLSDLAQVNAAQAELNEDERQFREAVRQEVERLALKRREDEDYHEARYKRLGAAFDDMEAKYANLRADYRMLNDRYMSHAAQIQNIAKITAERDYYKLQAKTYADELERMGREHAIEIERLRGEIRELESRIAKLDSGKESP